MRLYASATFCVQPPGDTMVRAAIVDAISVGCIPVLLHPAQLRLWPWHWDAAGASAFSDWSNATERNATALLRASPPPPPRARRPRRVRPPRLTAA